MGNEEISKGPISYKNFLKDTLNYQDQNVKYAISHMKGWRQYMEDASINVNNFPLKNHYLFGVFDGHGGGQVAKYVQKHFSLQLYLNKKFKQKKYEQSLVQTFNKMDYIMQTEIGKKELTQIRQKQIAAGNRDKLIHPTSLAGCTANVCYINDTEIIVANAGDSRCVACVNGKAVALSNDHHPQDKKELKRIKKAGGFVSNGRVNQTLNLSRSIGDIEYKNNRDLKAAQQMISSTPDVLKINREGVQFIIMGCDGIWQTKSNEKMIDWVRARITQMTLQNVVQSLLQEQLAENQEEYYGTDNMTAILIIFK